MVTQSSNKMQKSSKHPYKNYDCDVFNRDFGQFYYDIS